MTLIRSEPGRIWRIAFERLVLAVGPRRASELLLTGREISGHQAAAWALVNEAVPADRVSARAEELADEAASAAPLSVRGSKRGIRAVLQKLSITGRRRATGWRTST